MKTESKDRQRLRGGSNPALDASIRNELVTASSSRRIHFIPARRLESTGLALNSLRLVPLNSAPFTLFDETMLKMSWNKPPLQMGAGLHNLGNTCFLNATLQCLTYIPPLANYALARDYAKMKNTTKSGFNALFALGEHIRQALQSPGRQLAPNALVSNLRRIGRMFRRGRQEDAHEFMRYLVEAMQAACVDGKQLPPGVADTSVVHRLFGGLLRSCLQCACCVGRPSLTYDPFLDLSLEITRAQSVEQALERFCAPETLDGDNKYRCERTNKKVTATKRFTIDRAPNVLALQLKRFEYGARGGKIDRLVKFPLALDLGPYMSQPSRGDAARKYALTGVLVHQGRSTHSGHYFAFVRSPAGGWYRMDDERVSPVSEAMVCAQQAYMLFYTKAAVAGDGGGTRGEADAPKPWAPALQKKQARAADGPRAGAVQQPPGANVARDALPLAARGKSGALSAVTAKVDEAGEHGPQTPPSPARNVTPRRLRRRTDMRAAGYHLLVARVRARRTIQKNAAQRTPGRPVAPETARATARAGVAKLPAPVAAQVVKSRASEAMSTRGVGVGAAQGPGQAVADKRRYTTAAPASATPAPAPTANKGDGDAAALRAALSFPRHYNAYGVDGISRWDDMALTSAAAAADALVRQQRPAFSRKRRDEYEESYDKGRTKKVKMARFGGPDGMNPFEAARMPGQSALHQHKSSEPNPKRGGGAVRRSAHATSLDRKRR